MNNKEFADFIGQNFHLALTPEMLGAFGAYSGLLMQWNKKMNLTRYMSEDEIYMLHFADSLAVNLLFERLGIKDFRGMSIVDAGTGAGFPSMPVKIARPGVNITLVESRERKCEFLSELVKTLGLAGVEVIHQNAGAFDGKGRFDLSFARALGKTGESLELTAPLVKPGGMALLWITQKQKDGLGAYRKLLGRLKVEPSESAEYTLPGLVQKRHVAAFKKLQG